MHSHASHADGNATDLNRTEECGICATTAFNDDLDREQSLEICKLLVAEGAKKISFNCHYIIKNINIANQLADHSHHIHVDGPKADVRSVKPDEKFTTCNGCALYSKCSERIFKYRSSGSEPWQNAELYQVDQMYMSSRNMNGVVRLRDSNNNDLVLSKKDSES